jgi:hypothetical protein
MATEDQIKIRVARFKTVAEVETEIDRVTRTTRLSGNYNYPDTQALLAALQVRKQQLSEQNSSGFKPYYPPTGAGAGRGFVNDDRSFPAIPKKKNNTKSNKSNSGPHPRTSTAPAVAAPTTQAGEVGTLAAKFGKPKPGKRLENPLGNFSSYTYQISLYMITPDAYNAFIQSERTNIYAINNITAGGKESIAQANQAFRDVSTSNNAPTRSLGSPPASSSTLSGTVNKGGAYLIAQSGGINNSSEQRAPGFDTDFYIEDLKLVDSISPSETRGPVAVESIQFKIIEPYGFSFISKLRRAQLALQASSSNLNYDQLMNATRNTFILGIKFLGYDENGEIIDPNRQSSTLGNPIGNAHGIYERFIDIQITAMKYRLDGKSVIYNVDASLTSEEKALGGKRGILDHGATIDGSNVREALLGRTIPGSTIKVAGLMSKLNLDQQVLKTKGAIDIASEWDVKFLGDAEKIANASLISPADLDKRFWPQSNATKTSEVNESKSKDKPKNTVRKIILTNGTPILQAINEIVKQSSYLENALLAVTKSELEPNKTKPLEESELNNPSPTVIEWFNIRPEIENLGWDNKQKDFVYKTTYHIQTYSTPYVLSAYPGLTTPYYGPDKRYEYWFTGKNSELLKLDVAFDNNFYCVTMLGSPDYKVDLGSASVPFIPGKQQNQPKQGFINFGAEAQNSYMTSLYDPTGWSTAKLTILGDPDFLMGGVADTISDKFYGKDGFTINPRGRQVFIEVNLNEPQDYDNDSGLLTMNKSIYFWDYPKIIKEDLESRGGGVILQVVRVTSSFSKGKFEQQLDCVLPIFNEKTADVKAEKEAARPKTASTTAAVGGGSGPHPRNSNSVNAQAAARIKRQGAPANSLNVNVNAQAEARIKRQGSQTPFIKPKQDQTTTIPTKNGQRVQDDGAGNSINPRLRR